MRKPRNNMHVRCRDWGSGYPNPRTVHTSRADTAKPKELRLFAKRLLTAADWLEAMAEKGTDNA